MSDVLVLNADAQPISYLPISVIQWKEAIKYMYHDMTIGWYGAPLGKRGSPQLLCCANMLDTKRRLDFQNLTFIYEICTDVVTAETSLQKCI